jgi:hypothetical protein
VLECQVGVVHGVGFVVLIAMRGEHKRALFSRQKAVWFV